MKEKQIQIPETLFNQLCQYHLNNKSAYSNAIRKGLQQKVEAIHKRNLYSQYKQGDDQARLDYLKVSGVPEIYIY